MTISKFFGPGADIKSSQRVGKGISSPLRQKVLAAALALSAVAPAVAADEVKSYGAFGDFSSPATEAQNFNDTESMDFVNEVSRFENTGSGVATVPFPFDHDQRMLVAHNEYGKFNDGRNADALLDTGERLGISSSVLMAIDDAMISSPGRLGVEDGDKGFLVLDPDSPDSYNSNMSGVSEKDAKAFHILKWTAEAYEHGTYDADNAESIALESTRGSTFAALGVVQGHHLENGSIQPSGYDFLENVADSLDPASERAIDKLAVDLKNGNIQITVDADSSELLKVANHIANASPSVNSDKDNAIRFGADLVQEHMAQQQSPAKASDIAQKLKSKNDRTAENTRSVATGPFGSW